jgi:hypothetical protein
MAIDSTFQIGFGGDCTINGKLFPVISWSGSFPADVLTFKNSKCGNHPVRASSYTDAMVTVNIDYNQTDQPFLVSQGYLISGVFVTNVYLKLSATSYDGWNISNMIIADTPQSLEVAGKIATSLSLKISGGTITPPGAGGGTSSF